MCDVCNGTESIEANENSDKLSINDNKLIITSFYTPYAGAKKLADNTTYNINYCPNCGKKIKG